MSFGDNYMKLRQKRLEEQNQKEKSNPENAYGNTVQPTRKVGARKTGMESVSPSYTGGGNDFGKNYMELRNKRLAQQEEQKSSFVEKVTYAPKAPVNVKGLSQMRDQLQLKWQEDQYAKLMEPQRKDEKSSVRQALQYGKYQEAYEDSYKSGSFDLPTLSKTVEDGAKRIAELEKSIKDDQYTLENWPGAQPGHTPSKEMLDEQGIVWRRMERDKLELSRLKESYGPQYNEYQYYVGRILADEKTDRNAEKFISEGKKTIEDAWKGYNELLSDPNNYASEKMDVENQRLLSAEEIGRKHYPLAVSVDKLSQEDRRTFYYLVGRGYGDLALKFANESLSSERKERQEKISQWAGKNVGTGTLATLGSIAMTPLAWTDPLVAEWKRSRTGLTSSSAGIGGTRDSLRAGAAESLNDLAGTISEKVPVLGGKGLGDLYQLGLSMADSYIGGALMGPAGASVMLGGSAFSSAYNQAIDKGADQKTALMQGASQGLAEVIFEYISLDKLFGESGGGFLKTVLAQGGVEASEETCTSIANFYSDRWIMGGMSEYETSVKEYMSKGLSEEEARKKAKWDFVENTAADALGGFLSGGGSGAVHTGISNSESSKAYGPYEKSLVAKALEIDPNNTFAQQMQKKVEKGESLTGDQLRQIVNAVGLEVANAVVNKSKGSNASVASVQPVKTETEQRADLVQASNPNATVIRSETVQAYIDTGKVALKNAQKASAVLDAIISGEKMALSNNEIDSLMLTTTAGSEVASKILGVEVPRFTEKATARKQFRSIMAQYAETRTESQNTAPVTMEQNGGQIVQPIAETNTVPTSFAPVEAYEATLPADEQFAEPVVDTAPVVASTDSDFVAGNAGYTAPMTINSDAGFDSSKQSASQPRMGYMAFAEKYRQYFNKNATDNELGTAYHRYSNPDEGGEYHGVRPSPEAFALPAEVVKAVDSLGKLFGLDISFEDLGNDNGYYVTGTNKVVMDINPLREDADNAFLFTAAHELGHAIRDRIGKEAWSALEEYAIAAMGGKKAVQDKQNQNAVYRNEADAREDVACDFLGKLMSDKNTLDTFCTAIEKGQFNAEYAKGIGGLIQKFVDKINTAKLSKAIRKRWGKDIANAKNTAQAILKAAEAALEVKENTISESDSVKKYAKKAKAATLRANEKDGDTIKKQIVQASERLNGMDPVVSIYDPFDTGTGIDAAVRWILPKITTTNIQIKGYGSVLFDEHWIRNGLKYVARSSNEVAAIIAVPQVLKRGVQIAHDPNHKGRGFSTTTFGAPVELNGKRGNMAVVVKETSPYHYDVHRILTPEGYAFEIPEYKNAEPTTEEAQSQKETAVITPISSASENSIADLSQKSNTPKPKKSVKTKENLARRDAEYLAAVESGDMETAQRMVDEAAKAAGFTTRTYRQTQSDFTVFDTHHTGAGTSDYMTPFGIFLKPGDNDIGIRGNKQMPLYASIKSPLTVANRAELLHHLRKDEQYNTLYEEIKNRTPIYEAKLEAAQKAVQDYISQWEKDNPTANSRDLYHIDEFNELSDKEDELVDEWERLNAETAEKAKNRIVDLLKEQSYDGVIIENDQGSYGRATKTFIAFDSTQVKSADPVTYDDNGNVIPLSERFNEKKPDIRYSKKDMASEVASDSKVERVRHRSADSHIITQSDIQKLRSIEQKSVNEFTGEEIKLTEKWARRFYQELGVKSPFFRAWFGDWRVHDKNSPAIVTQILATGKINTSTRTVKNEDTKWSIKIDNSVFNDSIHYAGKDKPYLERLLSKIDVILNRAILLDTAVSGKKSNNKKGSTQFMHYLYTVVEYNGNPFLAKITVEEYETDGKHRAYNVERIKMSTLSRAQYSQIKSAYRGKFASSADSISVADLAELVKEFDKKYSPKLANQVLLNDDGTPMVVYHGTDAVFEEFRAGDIGIHVGTYDQAQIRISDLENAQIIPLYASIKNPLRAAYDFGDWHGQNVAQLLIETEQFDYMPDKQRKDVETRLNRISAMKDQSKADAELRKFLQHLGFDGIVYENQFETEAGSTEFSDSYIAFEPTQLKSVQNTGLYDPNNPKYMYSKKDNVPGTDTYTEQHGAENRRSGLSNAKIPTYDELVKKPDIQIVDIRQEKAESAKELRKRFKDTEEYRKIMEAPVENEDTDTNIFFSNSSFTHSFSNPGIEQIWAVYNLREIVRNAVLTHKEVSRKSSDDNCTGVYTFFGAVRSEKGVQPVKLKVKEYEIAGQSIPESVQKYLLAGNKAVDFASLYDSRVLLVEDIEKEDVSSSAASTNAISAKADNYPSTSSAIRIADLVDLVNGKNLLYIPKKKITSKIPTPEEVRYLERYRVAEEQSRVEKENELRDAVMKDVVAKASSGKKTTGNRNTKSVKRSVKTIEELVAEFGAIPEGENPARTVIVPDKTDKNTHVRRTVRTAMEATVTPDSMLPVFEDRIIEGSFGYEPVTNKQRMQSAYEWVESKDIGSALNEWLLDVGSGKLTADLSARGMLLYNNYANASATETDASERKKAERNAADILSALSRLTTAGAQITQFNRMLKKLSPETQIYALERNVQKLQETINSELEASKRPKIELNLNSEWMGMWAKELRKGPLADSDFLYSIEGLIFADVAKQVPKRFIDKWNAWRYLSMLGNPKTLVRNTFGNALFMPAKALKDAIGTGLEHIFVKDKSNRTKALKGDKDVKQFAEQDYKSSVVKQLLDTGNGKYSMGDVGTRLEKAIRDAHRNFDAWWLRYWQKATNYIMNDMRFFSDSAFMSHHYETSFARIAKARGITAKMLSDGAVNQETLDEMRAYAVNEALKATYKDVNAVSKFMSKLKSKNKIVNFALEGIVPFRATPANVMVRAVEYSPVGLIKAVTADLYKVQKGQISSSEYLDRLSSGLSGTAIWGLGWLLASLGLIRVGADDDEKREGKQNYSLEIGDWSITLDWVAPASIPFFMGAEMREILGADDGAGFLDSVMDATSTFFAPMLEMSMLSGMQDLLDTFTYGDGFDFGQMMMAFFVQPFFSYIGQAVPTVLGQVANILEPNRTTTYVGDIPGQVSRNVVRMLAKISEKIPFVDWRQMDYVDTFGRKEANGPWYGRILNNFFNPAYVNRINVTDPDAEIRRLEEVTGEEISPKRPEYTITVAQYDAFGKKLSSEKIALTAEQFEAYSTAYGQQYVLMMTEMMASTFYDTLSDEEKVEAISEIDQLAKEYGKIAAGVGYKSQDKILDLADKHGIPVAEIYGVKLYKDQLAKDEMLDAEDRKSKLVQMISNVPEWSDTQKAAVYSYAIAPTVPSIGDHKPNSEQKTAYSETYGKYASEVYESIVHSDQFASLSDEQKSAMIDNASDLVSFYAKKEWATKYGIKSDSYDPETESHKFDTLIKAGLSYFDAYTIVSAVQPQDGETTVSDIRKWQAIVNSSELSDSEKDKAIRAYMDSDNLAKYDACSRAGVTAREYVALRTTVSNLKPLKGNQSVTVGQKWDACIKAASGDKKQDALLRSYMSDEQVSKYDTCRSSGVTASMYVEYYNAKYSYGDGNGSWKQEELENWLNSKSWSNKQKSALWTSTNSGWKYNPFA